MKKVISFISACLIAISCIVINSSADEAPGDASSQFPLVRSTCEDYWRPPEGYDLRSSNYIYYHSQSTASLDFDLIYMSPDLPFDSGYPCYKESDSRLYVGEAVYNKIVNSLGSDGYYTSGFLFYNHYGSWDGRRFEPPSYDSTEDDYYIFVNKDDLRMTTVPIYNSPFEPNDSIPNPYTITYNPNISLNMQRETELLSIDSVDVTVHLNQEFIDWYIHRAYETSLDYAGSSGYFSESNDMSVSDMISSAESLDTSIDISSCGHSESLFFITSSDVSSALYDCTYSTVYTYLSDQRYSIVDKQSGAIDGSTSTAVYANGYYPYFDISFNQLSGLTSLSLADYNTLSNTDVSFTFTVDLRQINWPSILDARTSNGLDNIDFPLQCVLTSNLRYLPEGNSNYNDTFNEYYGFSSNGYDSETGATHTSFGDLFDTFETESSYYDHFINEGIKDSPWYIYTKSFSFTDSLPDYVPLKDMDGNEVDLSGNPGNQAKNPVKPRSYQSVEDDGTLSPERTEQEQLDYDNSFKLAHNFGSQEFTDFDDLFSTSGSYFDFLSSCLKIFPSWFLAIFTAFFTLLLALAIIKFILD